MEKRGQEMRKGGKRWEAHEDHPWSEAHRYQASPVSR